jgi:hypothetical protein
MKTDALIRALAADQAIRAASVERYFAPLLAAALVASLLLFAFILGPRADIASAAQEPRFLFKFVVTLTLAASAGALLLYLARPAAPLRLAWLSAAPLLLAAAVLLELALVPVSSWTTKLVGTNWYICLTMVPLLSLPLLAAALATLRHGAPTRPMLSGAAAGLFAGGLAATIYAAHCTDDSPLFVATWYTIAIGIVATAGALIGRQLLRW